MTQQRTSGVRRIGWEAALLVVAILGAAIASLRPGALGARRSAATGRPDPRGDSLPVPVVRPTFRPHGPLPLVGDTARGLRGECLARAMAHANHVDPDLATRTVVIADSFSVSAVEGGPPDSAVYEGSVVGPTGTTWTWHCAVPATWNPLRIGDVRSERELPWPETAPRFELTRALADAAARECVARAFRLFREYEIRTQRRERSGDTLIVSGEAFPLLNDVVRGYRCKATIRGGVVTSLSVVETK